jgi:uncharacterized OB-fold protein
MKDAIITESEFDSLPPQTQILYLYCPKCGFFYLAINKRHHLCGGETE